MPSALRLRLPFRHANCWPRFWTLLSGPASSPTKACPTRARIALVPVAPLGTALAFQRPIAYPEEEVAKRRPRPGRPRLALDAESDATHHLGPEPGFDYLQPACHYHRRLGPGYRSRWIWASRAVRRVCWAVNHVATSQPAVSWVLPRTAEQNASLGSRRRPPTRRHCGRSLARVCLALGALARMVLEDRHGENTAGCNRRSGGAWKDSLNPFRHEFRQADRSVRELIFSAEHQRPSEPTTGRPPDRARVSDDVEGWHAHRARPTELAP